MGTPKIELNPGKVCPYCGQRVRKNMTGKQIAANKKILPKDNPKAAGKKSRDRVVRHPFPESLPTRAEKKPDFPRRQD